MRTYLDLVHTGNVVKLKPLLCVLDITYDNSYHTLLNQYVLIPISDLIISDPSYSLRGVVQGRLFTDLRHTHYQLLSGRSHWCGGGPSPVACQVPHLIRGVRGGVPAHVADSGQVYKPARPESRYHSGLLSTRVQSRRGSERPI